MPSSWTLGNRSFTRIAPSSRLYCVCRWRCVNSAIDAASTPLAGRDSTAVDVIGGAVPIGWRLLASVRRPADAGDGAARARSPGAGAAVWDPSPPRTNRAAQSGASIDRWACDRAAAAWSLFALRDSTASPVAQPGPLVRDHGPAGGRGGGAVAGPRRDRRNGRVGLQVIAGQQTVFHVRVTAPKAAEDAHGDRGHQAGAARWRWRPSCRTDLAPNGVRPSASISSPRSCAPHQPHPAAHPARMIVGRGETHVASARHAGGHPRDRRAGLRRRGGGARSTAASTFRAPPCWRRRPSGWCCRYVRCAPRVGGCVPCDHLMPLRARAHRRSPRRRRLERADRPAPATPAASGSTAPSTR